MKSDQGMARLQEWNRRFVSGESLRRDLLAQGEATAVGQHPFAVVLSCIDSRSAPDIVFDSAPMARWWSSTILTCAVSRTIHAASRT